MGLQGEADVIRQKWGEPLNIVSAPKDDKNYELLIKQINTIGKRYKRESFKKNHNVGNGHGDRLTFSVIESSL